MAKIDLLAITPIFAIIDADESPADVLARADIPHEAMLVVTALNEENMRRPVTVIDWRGISAMRPDTASLRMLATRLPSLVTMEMDEDCADAHALLAVADTLSRFPAVPGVILERNDEILTALSRTDIAAVLPLVLLSEDELRGDIKPTDVGARYTCGKCEPPSFHVPKPMDQRVPTCRRVWFHGPMEIT